MPGVLIKYSHAPVAQRTEQRSSKPKVVGSNPAGGAWAGDLCSNFRLCKRCVKQENPKFLPGLVEYKRISRCFHLSSGGMHE